MIFSKGQLRRLLGMVNENYGKEETEKLKKIDRKITDYEVNNFYLRSGHKLSSILSKALENLSDRSLIQATPVKMICKLVGGHKRYFVADDEDIKKILEIERKALDEMGYEKKSEVQMKPTPIKQKYYSIIDNACMQYKWLFYYDAYKIVFNYDDINRFIPRLKMSLNDALVEHSKKIAEYLNHEAENLYNNDVEKTKEAIANCKNIEEYNRIMNEFHYPGNYVMAQKLLAKELIEISNVKEEPVLEFEDDDSLSSVASYLLEDEYCAEQEDGELCTLKSPY